MSAPWDTRVSIALFAFAAICIACVIVVALCAAAAEGDRRMARKPAPTSPGVNATRPTLAVVRPGTKDAHEAATNRAAGVPAPGHQLPEGDAS